MRLRSLMPRLAPLGALLAGEDGQATAEYSLVTMLMMGTLAVGFGWPFTRDLFVGLQAYIDLYFYALNLAIG